MGSVLLEVRDQVTDQVAALEWLLDVPNQTLNLVSGGSRQASVSISYTSGLVLSSFEDGSGWLFDQDWSSLLNLTSSADAAISVSGSGMLVLSENWPEAVQLTASLQCRESVASTLELFANLQAGEMDVDFGNRKGLQFEYKAGASTLDIPVYIRPRAGTFLRSFQLKLFLPNGGLNSGPEASFIAGEFPGVESQLDNPSNEVVLSAANADSQLSGDVFIGTITLAVSEPVGETRVDLVEGEIMSIVVVDAGTGNSTELQFAPVVAGTGFVSVLPLEQGSGLGSTRRLGGAPSSRITSPWDLASRSRAAREPRRKLSSACDPCTQRVAGDFNGDCVFLSSDVLHLKEFIASRVAFASGEEQVGPHAITLSWP